MKSVWLYVVHRSIYATKRNVLLDSIVLLSNEKQCVNRLSLPDNHLQTGMMSCRRLWLVLTNTTAVPRDELFISRKLYNSLVTRSRKFLSSVRTYHNNRLLRYDVGPVRSGPLLHCLNVPWSHRPHLCRPSFQQAQPKDYGPKPIPLIVQPSRLSDVHACEKK